MRKLHIRTRYRKDVKRLAKRGYDIHKLDAIVKLLMNDKPLPPRCRPHRLAGDYLPYWDLHVAPDWILIYLVHNDTLELYRTGTHADLFT